MVVSRWGKPSSRLQVLTEGNPGVTDLILEGAVQWLSVEEHKTMTFLSRLFLYLDGCGIRYSHSTHAPAQTAIEVADAERMPAHELAKTVVYFGDRGYGMVVVPADDLVDLGEVGRLLGLSFIRLASESELRELFPDCELGAMAPFGTFHDLPVVVDRQISQSEFIAFTAGTHCDVIRMGYADFRDLVKPAVGSFAISEVLI